ncbi:MAG: hypothetical protein DYH02_10085 [Candidatus Omnitrophica bacterium COP1]|nr:hypothetical protein [Candidatus Omnitrophica bacterium COP1]
MNELESQVCQLLFKEQMSNKEAAQRLNLTPAEVLSIAVKSRTHQPHVETNPHKAASETEEEQIQRLRRQVRQGLLERTQPGAIEEIPAHALVRLWSLIEDQKLIQGDLASVEDPILDGLAEEIKKQIFSLLDQAVEG